MEGLKVRVPQNYTWVHYLSTYTHILNAKDIHFWLFNGGFSVNFRFSSMKRVQHYLRWLVILIPSRGCLCDFSTLIPVTITALTTFCNLSPVQRDSLQLKVYLCTESCVYCVYADRLVDISSYSEAESKRTDAADPRSAFTKTFLMNRWIR